MEVECSLSVMFHVVSLDSDSPIPLHPAHFISSCSFFLSVFQFQGGKKYLQQVWWMRQYSSSAVQIKSGLGFPQTHYSQCSISFRAKKGLSVCMGEGGTIRSPWPSCWLGFSALQINCCTLTFKASLIELSVAYRAMLGLIALFYQHSATGQWVSHFKSSCFL